MKKFQDLTAFETSRLSKYHIKDVTGGDSGDCENTTEYMEETYETGGGDDTTTDLYKDGGLRCSSTMSSC